jgi:hypothetical protein
MMVGVALALTLGCGGDGATGPATSRNDPGTGTATLVVRADIDASNVPGGMSTDYTVSLRDGLGNRVSGATVTIYNASVGTLTLPETAAGSGEYFNTRLDFPAGDFRLDVVRGSDNVHNVILGGPGVHTITAPVAGSVATAGQPMTVRWTVPSRAKSAILETSDFGPLALPDTGAYVIAGANNPANSSQRVRVSRYNEVDVAGGLPGSRLRVTVENTVEPINVQ